MLVGLKPVLAEAQEADSLLLETVRERYVAVDDNPFEGRAVNRFQNLPGAVVTQLLPNGDFCTTYTSLEDGTYCYRARAGEPFEVRQVIVTSTPRGTEAMSFFQQGLGSLFEARRSLIFPYERVEQGDLVCVSYFINQLLHDSIWCG